MKQVVNRALRGAYWFGLLAGPFLGAALLAGAVFVGLEMAGAGVVGPTIAAAVAPFAWMGLVRAYRAFVPLPCVKCGGSARAASLNPITIRCQRCGHVQQLATRVLGA